MPKDGGGHVGNHHSPSPDSLLISLIFFPLSFPSAGAHESLRLSLHVPFSTPLFFLQPLVCSFGALIQSPASISFSLPPTGRLCSPITLTVQDATRARACAYCLCACMCVCSSLFEGQVQGPGTPPTCFPHGSGHQRDTRQKQAKKNKNL